MALGKLRATKAVEEIVKLKDHPNRWVRTEVTKALKRITSRV
ncbi:HEAT repeat domain-containing protein [Acinetobacter baumannii]